MEHFSDKQLAKLLKIPISDFRMLKHGPLLEDQSEQGAILGYFMHISPENAPQLLGKIALGQTNFLWFSALTIKRLLDKEKKPLRKVV
ncbi:hypothetical protein MTO98_09655 [Mucilaginibacter sp. SMC90]|uniref:hypothetical protein n=1 Tax=Mucilaginibacter sp. SMC90 TaxID=2929803 RepID=UPI001FB27154|nr:hypothetical protein [Mucilaginibacter sp. SMC90]UOE51343.1 hypothetical protein MTO98_09655 [Mucilaginibacter sp. SMC90]